MARIESLPPLAKELLEVVAVAVRPITTAIAGYCLKEVSESLRFLVSANLVRIVVLDEPERGFEPYADEVRRATLQLIGERRIGELHRTLVAALEVLPGVEPHWLLSHYRGGGLHERAREYSIIAAKRALDVLAFDHAASMYLSALEYVTEKDPSWCEINVGCAEAMAKAGRGEEAAQAYVRAAAVCTGREQIALRSLAVSQWMRSGHVDRGLELLKYFGKGLLATMIRPLARRALVRSQRAYQHSSCAGRGGSCRGATGFAGAVSRRRSCSCPR